MNGTHARGILVSLLLIALASIGCDTFLGVPLEDQDYKAPSFSLSTPLRVVEDGDTVRVTVELTGGYDYVVRETSMWRNASSGDQPIQTGWLFADFLMNATPGMMPDMQALHGSVHYGPHFDDLQTFGWNVWVHVYPSLDDAYQLAIEDASVAEASEVVDTLWAITDDAPYLTRGWGELSGTIQMATWLHSDSHEGYVNDIRMTDEVTWVAIPYQIIHAFDWASMTDEQIHIRLAQYLGLPSDTDKNKIMLLNVTPGDLRRPSMDPEIDDRSAQLEWSAAADTAYQAWFEGNMDYTVDGYPWTRLGYTYDWGDPFNHVGASEYIIREGAYIEVYQILDTATFFRYYADMYGWIWVEPGIQID